MSGLLLGCVGIVLFAVVHSRCIATNVQHSRCERQAGASDEGRLNALSCQRGIYRLMQTSDLIANTIDTGTHISLDSFLDFILTNN